MLEPTNDAITTENNTESEMPKQDKVNTDNSDEAVVKENENELEELNRPTPPNAPGNVNIENTTQVPTGSTPKEDWSSLMFSSDDSLFDKMTKQLKDETNKFGEKRGTPTSTITRASTSTQNNDTLPDIVPMGKKSDAVTGLLMLGADPDKLDTEIHNELVMPVDKPKQPDISKPNTDKNTNKEKRWKKKNTKNQEGIGSPRRSARQSEKTTNTKKNNEWVSEPTKESGIT